jgi:phage terminase large subunit-like protein
MTKEEKLELIKLLEEKERRKKRRKIYGYYPDTGILRRELYQKHLSFFRAGATARERLFMAANRVGKTEGAGGVEITYHLTGEYPHWWEGRRFYRPTKWWAAGNTAKTTRDIIQNKLMGPREAIGTGLIPGDAIESMTNKAGVPDALDTILIKHKSGGLSRLQLKSYDQGRTAFEGEELDGIWLDEEPPLPIYTECLLRTMDTSGTGEQNGLIMLTFTPLMGMSETVLTFLPGGEIQEKAGSKSVTMASWDDVPHLTDADKAELLASIPPFQRDARSKGLPQLGAGAIYPVPESDITVDDFDIPEHWPKFYGMDVGWNRTAVNWYAWDKQNDVIYQYAEHYRGQAEPSVHADAIKAKGDWIPGVIDPASNGRSQHDGQQLISVYKKLGLDLQSADNSVEAGIYEVWQRFSTGRLKIFKSCRNTLGEYRLYRRDENGKIVKTNDHSMDAKRYAIKSGVQRATTKPDNKPQEFEPSHSGEHSWMG